MMFFALECFQLSNLFWNHFSIAEMQAYLNLFTIMCAITQNHLNWCSLALNQKFSFQMAMCFAYRKLISIEYTRFLSFGITLDILYKLLTKPMQRSFDFNLFEEMWTSCFGNVGNLLRPDCDLIVIYPQIFSAVVILIVIFLFVYYLLL